MDIWFDSAKSELIKSLLPIFTGITTNPTLMGAVPRPKKQVLADLLHIQEGPVAVQVMSDKVQEMVQEGQDYFQLSNRLIIKVPVTKAGLEAIYLISRQGITTMATAVASASQVLTSAIAGADYIAPYLNRIGESGEPLWNILEAMQKIVNNYKFKTRILAASIKSLEQVTKCAEIGIYGVTLGEAVFNTLIESHPLTMKWVIQFKEEEKETCRKIHSGKI